MTTSRRGGLPAGPRVALTLVDPSTSGGPPACDHFTIAARTLGSSCFEWLSGTPMSDAGHGGMYFASTTVPMPSEIFAASAAVVSVQCAAPTCPAAWHDAQFACSA